MSFSDLVLTGSVSMMFFNFIAIALGEIEIIHSTEWEIYKTNDLMRFGKSYICGAWSLLVG